MKPVEKKYDIVSQKRHAAQIHSGSDKAISTDIKRGRVDPHLVCLLHPQSPIAEEYSRLRLALEHMRKPDQGLVVGVTSPDEGDGKTLTAINLAGALAQDTKARVLLADTNLRGSGPGICNYLDLKTLSGPGIIDWLNNVELNKEEVIHYLPGFNLYLMCSGGKADLPYELLKSPRLDELFSRLRQRYDFVVLDTPQILSLPDTELISRVVDGFLIVVKADYTSRTRLEESLNFMSQEKVLGLVFNSVFRTI